MDYRTLSVRHTDAEGWVALVALNRPEKRNALNPEMMAEIHSALDELESDATRVVILTGNGKSFCAGMDLSVLKQMSEKAEIVKDPGGEPSPKAHEESRRIASLFRRVYTFSKPLIAAVNGYALAGGCGLATLCDFTLAASDASFGYTEARIGFMPAFVSVYLIRQIGEKRARDLLLSGRIVKAAEAKELGLVNEVVEPETLLPRASKIAANLLGLSPVSLAFTKRLLADMFEAELDRAMGLAIEASSRIRSTHDFREGLSAFLEKRSPSWRGD
ncbi:MAG: enoyl-CoA hydratase/isomerase family protein [Acidobacteriota bacterium]|nr:enoyl-CoA hydratase/isomerase family protein [Acidobacteriota bacterium]